MSIGTIAQRNVVTISSGASLQQAARLMRERHIGCLAVTEEGDGAGGQTLVGVITDRDLALQVLAEGADPRSPVARLCNGPLFAMPENGSIAEAAALMRDSGVRRLLLVNREQRLTGIVSVDDLISSYADQLSDLADALDLGIRREAANDLPRNGTRPVPQVLVPAEFAQAWQRVMQP